MVEESGLVVATEGEMAWVETSRRSSCGSCEAKGCGTGALSQVLGRRRQRLRVKNPIAAATGDAVVLGLPEAALLQGAVVVYLVPLLALLAGGLLGEIVAPQLALTPEVGSILFALGALACSFLWLRRFNRRAADDDRFNAVILRRADAPAATISFHPNK
ncbi:MAG: SoxR reducing system RseC family protein [Gammaproteobacteria bacterium]|nr:SoxR reducing system RseC family protein [Gammaproteobacteria bacterium]